MFTEIERCSDSLVSTNVPRYWKLQHLRNLTATDAADDGSLQKKLPLHPLPPTPYLINAGGFEKPITPGRKKRIFRDKSC